MHVDVPASIQWMRKHPEASAWLDATPATLRHACEAWDLRVDGPPYDGGMVSLVIPVVDADGTRLVTSRLGRRALRRVVFYSSWMDLHVQSARWLLDVD